MKILDTDTCIAILRGQTAVIERRHGTVEQVVTTWISAGELFYGAAKSKDPVANRDLVGRFLETLLIIGVDLIASQFFGLLRTELELAGQRLPDADLWIGAIARRQRAAVVTGNKRHFERMHVETENWMG